MSMVGDVDAQEMPSAANGVEMMRPVIPAAVQTCCCRSKSYISW